MKDRRGTYHYLFLFIFSLAPFFSVGQCTNYTVTVTSGSWQSEVSWSITQGATTFASGGAPATLTVCLNNGTYSFNMFDSWGDGWNGAIWTVSCTNGTQIASGTLANGSSGTQTFTVTGSSCLPPTCPPGFQLYNFNVTSGSFPSEVSWNIMLNGAVVLSGGAPYTGTICMASGCYVLSLFDAFGDGWDGATYTLSLNAATVYTGTLTTGSSGTAAFSIDGGDCSAYTPVTASDCLDAVNVCDNLSFTIDPNGYGAIWEIPVLGSVGNPDLWAGDGVNSPWGSDNWGCLRNEELNSTWMIVNIWGGGSLEFTFGGLGTQAGYYDWIMYPYNGVSTCQDITYNILPPVRCNWNDVPWGGTGLAATTPPGGDPNNYEPPLWVNAGEQYVICFSNWSSVTTTVPLQFGGTAIVSCLDVFLPVNMVSFTAFETGNLIELNWSTASEENNEFFSVEKSIDAIAWREIAQLEGHGTTSSWNDYKCFDVHPEKGWNYYRLRQHDSNGMERLSNIADVFYTGKGNNIYPNPGNGKFIVDFDQAVNSDQLFLRNQLGSDVDFFVQTIHPAPSVFQIQLVNQHPGVYFLGVSDSECEVLKIIVK